MKQRVIDVLAVVLIAGVLLGGYYVYGRIKLHNDLDVQLIELVKRLEPKP